MKNLFSVEDKEKHLIYKIFGIKIKIRKNLNNKIYLKTCRGGVKQVPFVKGLKVEFKGRNNTVVIHTPSINFKNCSFLLSDNCKIEIGSSTRKANKLHINLWSDNQSVIIGNEFSCTDKCEIIISREKNLKVEIGNNCMFAENTLIRPSDGHTILNKDTNEIINRGGDIHIKDNVWVGAYSIILKNVTIESNCIIGAGSTVTKSCNEQNSIYAGVPAKKVKSNIIWDRNSIQDYTEKNNICKSEN